MVLPVIKLTTLLIKQISRPVVNSLSEYAKEYPKFRRLIIRIAQRYHSIDFTSQSVLFGFGKPIKIKPISDEEAVTLGTKLIGETSMYIISASLILYEYDRSSKKEAIKEQKRQYEMAVIRRKIHEYGMVTEQQEAELKELQRKVFALEDKNKSLTTKLFESLKSK